MITLAKFEEEGHRYIDTAGTDVPSVTQVLKGSGYIDYEGIEEEVLQRKGEIGKTVHLGTLYFDDDDLEWSTVPSECEGYIRGYEKFIRESGFKPVREQSEKPRIVCVQGMRYGMTPDRDGFMAGKRIMLDLKCVEQIRPWWQLQTALYEDGLRSEDQIFRQRGTLRLMKDGTYRLDMHGSVVDYHLGRSAVATEIWKRNHEYYRRKAA